MTNHSFMRCRHCPITAVMDCRGEDVRRFCELIDPGHAAYDPGYIDTLLAMGHGEPEAAVVDRRPTIAESLERVRAMHACPYRSIDAAGCGCSGARCALRHGEIVSYADCFECIRRYGRVEPRPDG